MKIAELSGKKILIVGYGNEGKSAKRFIEKHIPGAVIGVADQNQGKDYLKRQTDYDVVIKSPGVRRSLITKPYTTPTNMFFEYVRNTVIGVTGTKGKSTTASLISHILTNSRIPTYLVGNIGTPALDVADIDVPESAVYVYELSSYQLEDIAYTPEVVVFTSLYPEHMDYHGGIDEYYKAKKNILQKATEKTTVVFNGKHLEVASWVKGLSCKTIDVQFESEKKIHTQLLGSHNADNIRLACAVASLFNIQKDLVIASISSFKPLPHRLEYIGTFKDISFYDDSISTTPESTIAALNSVSPVTTLFLGGFDRGYNFNPLARKVAQSSVETVILFPDSGSRISEALEKQGQKKLRLLTTRSMEEAVLHAYKYTKKGTICLLSSASPSYSLWSNYQEKGEQFKKFVLRYAQK